MKALVTLENLTLPPQVEEILTQFVEASEKAFNNDLRSIVLYGSAAEGKLRATSDVNLMLVLALFDQRKADGLRSAMRIAYAAIQLRTMFILEGELPAALRLFAQKFADVLRRHRVLLGEDPFAGLIISREHEIVHLRQELLNLVLRLRASYVLIALRAEQLALLVADSTGPLRSCAATLLALEGKKAPSTKEALKFIASTSGQTGWQELLASVSEAREKRILPPGAAETAIFRLMDLAYSMYLRAEALS